jgi:hypothetical protein
MLPCFSKICWRHQDCPEGSPAPLISQSILFWAKPSLFSISAQRRLSVLHMLCIQRLGKAACFKGKRKCYLGSFGYSCSATLGSTRYPRRSLKHSLSYVPAYQNQPKGRALLMIRHKGTATTRALSCRLRDKPAPANMRGLEKTSPQDDPGNAGMGLFTESRVPYPARSYMPATPRSWALYSPTFPSLSLNQSP